MIGSHQCNSPLRMILTENSEIEHDPPGKSTDTCHTTYLQLLEAKLQFPDTKQPQLFFHVQIRGNPTTNHGNCLYQRELSVQWLNVSKRKRCAHQSWLSVYAIPESEMGLLAGGPYRMLTHHSIFYLF